MLVPVEHPAQPQPQPQPQVLVLLLQRVQPCPVEQVSLPERLVLQCRRRLDSRLQVQELAIPFFRRECLPVAS